MSFEKLSKINFDEFIHGLRQSLRASYELIFEDTEFDEYMQSIRVNIESGDLDQERLNDELINYLASTPLSPHYPFLRAAVLTDLTLQALARKDYEAFIALALQASAYVEGAAVHAQFNALLDIPAALRRRTTQAAAAARSETFQLAKDQALLLISQRRPSDGWDDLTHAAESIEEELGAFIKSNKISLTKKRIVSNLRQWAKEDASFRDSLNRILTPSPR